MHRYFIELAYLGTRYSGFQIQQNAVTIQSEVEKALETLFREKYLLTGSSRTDAGVHALQNYFHFDSQLRLDDLTKKVYNLNAILPYDISVKNFFEVKLNAHSRFDAIRREYGYYIYESKNPFLKDRAFFFPYQPDLGLMNEAASLLKEYIDFTTFSKRNTQVNNFNCTIIKSEWTYLEDRLCYNVSANRFLRGMVKGLVGTMLRVGLRKITVEEFRQVILSKDCALADFSVPSHGLYLEKVVLKEDLAINPSFKS